MLKFTYVNIFIYFHVISPPNLGFIRAVETAPEKTPTEKVKFFELRDHHQSILVKKKLPPLIYTVQVQYDHDDHDHDHPTL